MWNNTEATRLLKIKYPIIQGPFGGRFSSVKLLSTVSNLGGLGSFGFNSFAPEEVVEVGQQIKASTQQPYNLNLWVPLENDPIHHFNEQQYENWKNTYLSFFQELGVAIPATPKVTAKFDAQLESILKLAPPVVSFIFGIPPLEAIKEFKRMGTKIIAAATTIEEALLIEETEVDFILATGKEAGGHRPSFLKTAESSLTTTYELVTEIIGKVSKPVIAAGGISNGQNAWKYLKMGVSAVQIGTAFLATNESGATEHHKSQLLSKDSYQTELSKVFTGRLARTIANAFSHQAKNLPHAPYPIQSQLLSQLMKKYRESGLVNKIPLWAGKPSSVLTEHSAATLFKKLVDDITRLESNMN